MDDLIKSSRYVCMKTFLIQQKWLEIDILSSQIMDETKKKKKLLFWMTL